jgi:glyoxylase-like metal-dependent hydrolase (beta-lactamase superfamily II)
MKLAPNLHRIGSDLVASYLIEDAGGVTIIDAGLPGHWAELAPELAHSVAGKVGAQIRSLSSGRSS